MSGQFHEVTERTPLRNDDLHLQDLRDGGELAKPAGNVSVTYFRTFYLIFLY